MSLLKSVFISTRAFVCVGAFSDSFRFLRSDWSEGVQSFPPGTAAPTVTWTRRLKLKAPVLTRYRCYSNSPLTGAVQPTRHLTERLMTDCLKKKKKHVSVKSEETIGDVLEFSLTCFRSNNAYSPAVKPRTA